MYIFLYKLYLSKILFLFNKIVKKIFSLKITLDSILTSKKLKQHKYTNIIQKIEKKTEK